jgi:hypothetical protein
MTKIALQAANGQYVCAEGGGGQKLVANRDAIGPWETFTLTELGSGKVALQAANGQYVCAEGGGGQLVVANRDARGPWEEFTLTDLGNDKVALQAANGQYVCAIGGGGQDLIANRDALGPWETFTKKSLEAITPSIASAHHWTFAEITDSVTIDSVSKAPAQLFNVKPSGQGRIGSAIALAGSNDSYISFGRKVGQFGRENFTVAFGVKIASGAKGLELLGNRTTDSHGNFFTIRVSPEQRISVEIDEDSNGKNYISLNSTPGINDGTWHHIAVVRQQNELRLYIDGNLSERKSASGVANIANGNELRTGKVNPSFLASPKAEYEDLRIYDRVLSDIQISALVPPLKEGEIEFKTKDGVFRIWNKEVADFGSIATNFEKLRLGPNTGVTLYKGTYFTDTFQEVVADLPNLSQTRLEAVPKSARIWSTVGKAFTGNWVIMAPNDQYLVLCPPLATSPEVSNLSLFDFHYNLERQWMQVLPSLQLVGQQRILEIPTDAGLSQSLICQPEDSLYQFSLKNERQDRWLRFVPDCRFALRTLSGKYLRAEGGGGGAVIADAAFPRLHEHFKLLQLEDNKVALQTLDKGLYVAAVEGGGGDVIAKVSKRDLWETFILEKLEENRIALKTAAKGLYVCAENGGGGKLIANRSQRGPWETFELLNLGGFDWTANREERAIFTRAMKMAKDENQMGELLPGEAALYEHYGYWGKTLVLYNSCPDFRALAGLNFNKTTSSIRLGPDTGATLYADINYSVTSSDRKNDIMDIVENVPNLGESQIGNDNLSSIKIWSSISPKDANVSFSISMSQDYRMKGEELEEFSSYRTILKFLPEVTEVEVWATDLTKFEIDETTYEVDEDRSVILAPNEMNRLMITSEAEGINTPGLKIRTNTMESHERVVIFPDREVHRQLANLKEGELWEAKDAEGNPLVDHSTYNADQVADVQRTITKTMATVSYVAAGSEDNKYLVDREISADAIDKPWQLSFATTAPVQEQGLSQSQFKQLADQASAPLAQGWRDGWRSFKDAVKKATSVVVGVIDKVVHVIVTTAEKVGAAIANAVQKVEDWIIDTAEKVGAFVEGVVEKIGVAAKKFVEYLRSIFDWGDILDTQRYLADAIDSGLGYAVKLADAAKEPVRNFMSELRGTVRDNLNTAIDKLEGDKTELEKSGPELPEQVEWLLSKLTSGNSKISNEGTAPASASPSNQASASSDPIESFVSNLVRKFERISKIMLRSLEGLGETIATLIRNPYRPQLALVAILKMVRDVMDEFLKLIEESAIDFLNIIEFLIKKIRELITTEINIPFITALFRKIGAGKLNALNFSTLLIAIPATILSKSLFGKKPFEGAPQLALSLSTADGFKITELVSRGLKVLVDLIPSSVTLYTSRRAMFNSGLKILLNSGIWLSSFPTSPMDTDKKARGYPYDIADGIHDVGKSNKELYWERVMWGWRTAMVGFSAILDLPVVIARVVRLYPTDEAFNLIQLIQVLLSCVDLSLTSVYVDSLDRYNSRTWKIDRTIVSQMIGAFPGVAEIFKFGGPKGLFASALIALLCTGTVIGFESDMLKNP